MGPVVAIDHPTFAAVGQPEFNPYDLDAQRQTKADKDLRKQLASQQTRDDIRWLMGSEQGRRIVWRLLDQAGVFNVTFDPNFGWMAFREGNRNLGLFIWLQIQTHCPELYPVMVGEQKADGGRTDDSRTNPN